MLEIKNIRKSFDVEKGFLKKEKFLAVDDVSLMLKQGENLGLVGESGCGKTTLSKIIMGLLRADSGEIVFEGHVVDQLKGKNLNNYRRSVQMVFQDPFGSLDPRMSIRNIIREAMHLDQSLYHDAQKSESKIVEVIRVVQLNENILNRYPHEFSGGERQRIAIARSLVLNPKLIILDEAVSSLDVIIQNDILNLLLTLQKQHLLTYIFITHNLKVVRKIAKKIAVMYQGKIVEIASTEKLFNNPKHLYTQHLLKAAVDYKSLLNQNVELNPSSNLIEKEPQHFVLE